MLISIIFISTESIFLVSLVPFTNMLGGFLGSLLFPYAMDKYSMKKILVNTQFFKTILLFLLIIQYIYFSEYLMLVYISVFLIKLLDSFAQPVSTALIPSMVHENYLMKANSLMTTTFQFTQIGGWAVGGILITILGAENTLILTVALYLSSTIVLNSLSNKLDDTKNKIKKNGFLEGWKLIWGNPIIFFSTLILIVQAMISPIWTSALLYPYILDFLNLNLNWWGYINTSLLVGLFIGGILAYFKSDYIENKAHKLLVLTLGALSLTIFLFGINKHAFFTLFIIFSYGLFQEINSIILTVTIQKEVKDNHLAKVFAAQGAIIMMVVAIATLVYGALGDFLSINSLYVYASFISLFSLFLSFGLLSRIKNKRAN